jgi:hypothetical protein
MVQQRSRDGMGRRAIGDAARSVDEEEVMDFSRALWSFGHREILAPVST